MPMPLGEWRQLVGEFMELDARRRKLLGEANPDKEQEYDQVCVGLMKLAGKLRTSSAEYMPETAGDEAVSREWKAIKSGADTLFKDLNKSRHQDWVHAVND